MSFEFLSNQVNITSLEGPEEPIVEKLLELGVNFNVAKNWDGRLIYKFFDVAEVGPGAFLLDSVNKKILFLDIHFSGRSFKRVGDSREISPEEFSESMSQKFPGADTIVYSCCYPDEAKTLFSDSSQKPLFIGSGSVEYKTVYNSRKKMITISPFLV